MSLTVLMRGAAVLDFIVGVVRFFRLSESDIRLRRCSSCNFQMRTQKFKQQMECSISTPTKNPGVMVAALKAVVKLCGMCLGIESNRI